MASCYLQSLRRLQESPPAPSNPENRLGICDWVKVFDTTAFLEQLNQVHDKLVLFIVITEAARPASGPIVPAQKTPRILKGVQARHFVHMNRKMPDLMTTDLLPIGDMDIPFILGMLPFSGSRSALSAQHPWLVNPYCVL